MRPALRSFAARLLAACALALVVLAGAAGPASAEDGCILDNCADRHSPERRPETSRPESRRDEAARPRGPSRPGDFDFYVLSLSWSPGFCAVGGGDEKGRDQCRRGAGLGFTVHGLWPQYEHGFPSDCGGRTNPPREALALSDGVYPDRGLARYEWRRHGTCSGLAPAEYFGAARSARDAVAVPARFKEPHDGASLSPQEVERAFVEANPGLRPGMVAAVCRDNTLEEVRVCLARDLRGFRLCPEVVRQRCRGDSLQVPPPR